jgi:thioredoxin 2
MSDSSVLIRCGSCKTLNRVPSEKLKSRPACGQCKTPLEFPRAPVNATAATFERDIFDWPEFVLLEFWAKWCGFCRMVEPVVSDIASWNAGRLKVVRVDVDAEPGLARRFMVKATPTFVVYKNGTQIARMDGAPKEKIELVQWVDQILKH